MIFALITVGIFVLDYSIKKHMDKAYSARGQRILAGGAVILKRYYNTGAAGNFLSGNPKAVKKIHMASLGLVFAELFLILPKEGMAMVKTGLAFLAGGGLCNLYDRLLKGYVIDYASFGFGPKCFRKLVFNVSDFFVFAGIFLCVAQMIIKEGEPCRHR